MKTVIPFIAIAILLIINSGCKKEEPIQNQGNAIQLPPPPPSPPQTNISLRVYAGWDFLIELPVNQGLLDGHASDLNNDIKEYSWTKISGPTSYVFDNKNAAQTLVRALEKGVYQFELTVTDKKGHFGKDTVLITVGELSTNPREIIFKDLPVICPWDCGVEIKNFYSHVVPGTYFKVFIKRPNNSDWVEAIPYLKYFNLIMGYYGNESSPYEYFIEGRPDGAGMYTYKSLYVFYYGLDVSNSLDVKIFF